MAEEEKVSSEERFDLYTENIVEKPWARRRRLVYVAFFVGGATLFGVIAAVCAGCLYPLFAERQETSGNPIVIATGETDEAVSESESELPGEGPQVAEKDRAQVIKEAQKSMVKIKTDKGNFKESSSMAEPDGTSIFPSSTGIILVSVENGYYIVTRYTEVENAGRIAVKFNDNSVFQANLAGYHRETNLAVLYAEVDENQMLSSTQVCACIVGNSYMLRQGQPMFMLGKIYGSTGSLNYGVCTGNGAVLEMPDLNVGLISTSLPNQPGDDGFLFDESGRLLGIGSEIENGSGCVQAYGILDIRPLLEKLINRQTIPYVGIYGITVTEEIKIAYELPDGVFISRVALDSPAFLGGLQPGDVIVAAGGSRINRMSDLSSRIFSGRPGQELVVTARRAGKDGYHEFNFGITLGTLSP